MKRSGGLYRENAATNTVFCIKRIRNTTCRHIRALFDGMRCQKRLPRHIGQQFVDGVDTGEFGGLWSGAMSMHSTIFESRRRWLNALELNFSPPCTTRCPTALISSGDPAPCFGLNRVRQNIFILLFDVQEFHLSALPFARRFRLCFRKRTFHSDFFNSWNPSSSLPFMSSNLYFSWWTSTVQN